MGLMPMSIAKRPGYRIPARLAAAGVGPRAWSVRRPLSMPSRTAAEKRPRGAVHAAQAAGFDSAWRAGPAFAGPRGCRRRLRFTGPGAGSLLAPLISQVPACGC